MQHSLQFLRSDSQNEPSRNAVSTSNFVPALPFPLLVPKFPIPQKALRIRATIKILIVPEPEPGPELEQQQELHALSPHAHA